jgi:hypothetical protein
VIISEAANNCVPRGLEKDVEHLAFFVGVDGDAARHLAA